MALVLKDRVKETSTTAGTGTLTLAGAVSGFQSFAAVGNGNTTYYAIADSLTGDWEVGIGTYTSSGTTLSRTTVLSSSNGGSLVSFTANPKDVFVTYPSEKSVYEDASNVVNATSFGAITATSAALTTGTITTAPVNNTDIVNKEYADAIASGIHFHEAVNLATTAALPANTYNNGTSGVGATLTANANGALSVDSTLTIVSERILVKNEAAGANNGVYTVTQVGSAGTPYILTRATDFDSVGTGVDQIDEGDFFLVTSGTANVNTAWVQQTPPPITIGTTPIVFQQFSAPITYTAGTGLSESPTYTFNIANTGVTATTYGSASQVPVFAVNAQGQLTSVTNTAIAISGAAVSGNIAGSAGSVANALTLGTYLTGTSYNGSAAVTAAVDATSTNTVSKVVARDSSGNFAAGTITAALSGNATTATTATNTAGGAANQISYNTAAGTTSYIVAPTTAGTYLNWNGSAFAYTAISTPASVTFNNSGSGDASGTSFNGSTARTISYNTVGAPSTGGTGATGTWGISISGNAATATSATSATTATNLAGGSAGTIPYQSAAGTTVQLAAGTSTYLLQSNGAAAPSWVAPVAAANNGALTMAVSGTGLSGSASFTANQAGASSFTVTSNATSANTASTIVARDASGNFSAGTITASLSGNATTATTAANVNNGTLTMNVSGTGLSGSQTFTANQAGAATFTVTSNATNANTGSTIVARDASGNFSAGTITATLSGNASTSSSTSGNAATATALSSGQSNWVGTGVINNVVGMLAWKNYNNSHVIFDASAGTSPSGGAVNNTNAAVAWSSTYPTLMGWNGGSTYGVRVDSARIADSITSQANSATITASTTPGAANTIVLRDGSGYTYVNYINSNTGNSENPAVSQVIVTNGDNFYRKASIAHLTGSLSGTAPINVTGTASNITAYTINQSVGTGNSPTFADLYVNAWFRNNTSNTGLYNQATTQHLSSQSNGYWDMSSTTSVSAIRFYTGGHVTSLRGYVYADSSNNIGFLNNSGSWSFQVTSGGNCTATGSVTAYSDETLKKDWAPVQKGFVAKLAKVKSGTYTRIDSEERQAGVGAQSLRPLLPETILENEKGILSVAYGNAAMVSAVELAKDNVELRARIEKLEALVAKLIEG